MSERHDAKTPQVYYQQGPSLRDRLAGMAMQGLLSNFDSSRSIAYDVTLAREGKSREPGTMSKIEFCDEIAKVAYEQADAMLRARTPKGESDE